MAGTTVSTDTSEFSKTIRLSVRTGGARPPCLDKTPGQCRGCYGWEQMLEAARKGGAWGSALIRCDCTGLTVRIENTEKS